MHIRLTHALTDQPMLLPVEGLEVGGFTPPRQPSLLGELSDHDTWEVDGCSYDILNGKYVMSIRRNDITLLDGPNDPRRVAAWEEYKRQRNGKLLYDFQKAGGYALCEVVTARGTRYLVKESFEEVERLITARPS